MLMIALGEDRPEVIGGGVERFAVGAIGDQLVERLREFACCEPVIDDGSRQFLNGGRVERVDSATGAHESAPLARRTGTCARLATSGPTGGSINRDNQPR